MSPCPIRHSLLALSVVWLLASCAERRLPPERTAPELGVIRVDNGDISYQLVGELVFWTNGFRLRAVKSGKEPFGWDIWLAGRDSDELLPGTSLSVTDANHRLHATQLANEGATRRIENAVIEILERDETTVTGRLVATGIAATFHLPTGSISNPAFLCDSDTIQTMPQFLLRLE